VPTIDNWLKHEISQRRLSKLSENQINIARTCLYGLAIRAEIYTKRLIAAAANKGDHIHEDTCSVGAYAALHYLRALYALERKSCSADIIEGLYGVAIQCNGLIAQL
jgi:hypothetical protein